MADVTLVAFPTRSVTCEFCGESYDPMVYGHVLWAGVPGGRYEVCIPTFMRAISNVFPEIVRFVPDEKKAK